MTHILTDCDGVLLDWCAGYRKHLRDIFGVARQMQPDELPMAAHDSGKWVQLVYGLSLQESWDLMVDFQESEGFGGLPPYPDALEWVPRLRKELGCTFTIISTAGGSEKVRASRLRNLDVFGPNVFGEVVLLPLGESKSEALRRFSASPWFDDHVPHVMNAHEIGHHSFHFDRFGENHSGVPRRVSSWESIYTWAKTHPPRNWAVAEAA